MKVKIKRIDNSLPLPKYETSGAVGFDFVCRENTTIPKGTVGFIPTNSIVEVPSGYMLMVTLRSSTPRKKGLLSPHGVGIIDQDYCGEEDEIKVLVYNFGNADAVIEKGERVAQGILVKVSKGDFKEVKSMKKESRGGFGSTDKR